MNEKKLINNIVEASSDKGATYNFFQMYSDDAFNSKLTRSTELTRGCGTASRSPKFNISTQVTQTHEEDNLDLDYYHSSSFNHDQVSRANQTSKMAPTGTL